MFLTCRNMDTFKFSHKKDLAKSLPHMRRVKRNKVESERETARNTYVHFHLDVAVVQQLYSTQHHPGRAHWLLGLFLGFRWLGFLGRLFLLFLGRFFFLFLWWLFFLDFFLFLFLFLVLLVVCDNRCCCYVYVLIRGRLLSTVVSVCYTFLQNRMTTVAKFEQKLYVDIDQTGNERDAADVWPFITSNGHEVQTKLLCSSQPTVQPKSPLPVQNVLLTPTIAKRNRIHPDVLSKCADRDPLPLDMRSYFSLTIVSKHPDDVRGRHMGSTLKTSMRITRIIPWQPTFHMLTHAQYFSKCCSHILSSRLQTAILSHQVFIDGCS